MSPLWIGPLIGMTGGKLHFHPVLTLWKGLLDMNSLHIH